MPSPGRIAGPLVAIVTAAALAVGGVPATASVAPAPVGDPTVSTLDDVYIVTLRGAPTASYAPRNAPGSTTRPPAGTRFDRERAVVERRAADLRARQDAALAGLGDDAPEPLYRLTTALNAVVVRLAPDQVKRLRAAAEVVRVERSIRVRLQSADATGALDLAGSRGAWEVGGGPESAGAGTVIGSVDSGIWPRNPSFGGASDRARGLPGFTGRCRVGASSDRALCGSKIVAADWFVTAFGADATAAGDELSPRDTLGHGTHSAAVAAGAAGVSASAGRQSFGRISGVAPGARIAAYKACWTAPDPDDDGCETADLVAAVDRAVGDGVDVLDVPVGSTPAAPRDSLSEALRHATAAGVFVATAAGNLGPGRGSVAQPAPWVATTAAASHRLRQGAVVLGDGTRIVGTMVADREVPDSPLVVADGTARHCAPGSLDPQQVTGSVVVCERGVVARVEKSAAVEAAGGVAMVLVNPTPQATSVDLHSVPTVHLDAAAAAPLRSYLDATDEPRARLDPTATDGSEPVRLLPYSGRGPVLDEPDLLKPDLAAPGEGILAATTPGADGRRWDLRSGTSVASAHVAGLAAVVRSVHPDWTPARIRSALMTTAEPVPGADGPFAQGSGLPRAARALDPGLVLDVNPRAYARWAAGDLPSHRLNLPSIAVGGLLDRTVVRRTLTNVSGNTESYSASVSGLPGLDVRVRPAAFTLAPGASQTVRIRIVRTAAAVDDVAVSGAVSWVGQTDHTVRVPVVVRPVAAQGPAVVRGEVGDERLTLRPRMGARSARVQVAGLAGAIPTPYALTPESDDFVEVPVRVSGGTRVLRVLAETNGLGDDVDLTLLRGETVVAEATGTAGREELLLADPPVGDLTVRVRVARAANGRTVSGRLFTWTVDGRDAGNVSLSTDVLRGAPGTRPRLTLTWRDLDATQRWIGLVGFGRGARQTLIDLR